MFLPFFIQNIINVPFQIIFYLQGRMENYFFSMFSRIFFLFQFFYKLPLDFFIKYFFLVCSFSAIPVCSAIHITLILIW